MDPRQILLVLQARWRVAVLVFLLVVAAVMTASVLLPKRYSAETQVMVDVRSPDPVAASLQLSPLMIPGNMSTQVEIIQSDIVARKVVKLLKLDESEAARDAWREATEGKGSLEEWLAQGLQRGIKARPSRDSNIITIGYDASNPQYVADVANAVAQAYIEASIELKVEPARQYAKWFGEQTKALREQVDRAQARLSDFQQKKGIVATSEAMDTEMARLNDLASRLNAAQSETRDAQSKLPVSGATGQLLPEVRQDTVVVTLRNNIASLEAKIKEAASNLGTKHPQYLRMQEELAELKNRLAIEARAVAGGYAASSSAGKTKEAELKAAFEVQKRKVLAMKREHDEIAVLIRDVETAKKAYEGVASRYNQTNLESQATRTNVSVLSAAAPPSAPVFPKPMSAMLFIALALGIVAACASAVGLELIDRRIRGAGDLEDMLQLPVLAVIERAGPQPALPGRRPASLPAT